MNDMATKLLKNPTLRQIAERSGVSTATVDRVISNRAKVSPRTKALVMDAIAALRSDERAPSGRTRRSDRSKSLRFGVVVEGGQAFVNSIERKFNSLLPRYQGLNVALEFYTLEGEYSIEGYKQLLTKAASQCDGLVVTSREHSEITACVNAVINQGVQVVTYTTDLNGSMRLGYSGMNNSGAGRVAGRLLGQSAAGRQGDVLLIVSAPYQCQYERELGFRRVLREEYPALRICESIDNHDLDSDCYSNLMSLFRDGRKPLGIYNVTGGTAGVTRALEELGWQDDVFYVAHELDEVSYPLLAEGRINVVIDQELRAELVLAINGLMYHCGALERAPAFTETSPIIATRENMNGPLEVDIPSAQDLVL